MSCVFWLGDALDMSNKAGNRKLDLKTIIVDLSEGRRGRFL
jgi:hypothetical protein